MMSYGKEGYTAGKTLTFTPSRKAAWVDSFNAMLLDEQPRGMSRNKLTEKLIQDGLRYNHRFDDQRANVSISLDGFSPEQVRLLQTSEGQRLILDLIRKTFNAKPVLSPILPEEPRYKQEEVMKSYQEVTASYEVPVPVEQVPLPKIESAPVDDSVGRDPLKINEVNQVNPLQVVPQDQGEVSPYLAKAMAMKKKMKL